MNANDFYKSLKEREILKYGPGFGNVQWKNTEACIDLYCECGQLNHFDGEFLFLCKCPKCGIVFKVCNTVQLIKLNQVELNFIKNTAYAEPVQLEFLD